jgi:1-phosphofructokinase/tagatose 6-phosphate kinase
MIITVTLNAAIDKSLSVPNFRQGRRHRSVQQTTMAGGKGVNVARTLKSLGQPVIATGFAGGPTGTRIVEQLTEESILNDFVRIREESRTNTAVHDPTSGEQTEINERGPAVSPKEVELFRDKLLYLAGGADIVVMAARCPTGSSRPLRRPDPRAAQGGGGDRHRHRRRADAPRRAGRARGDLAERHRGRGARRHEFNDDEDHVIAVRRCPARRPRGDHDPPDGCVACVNVDGAPTLQRLWIEPQETVATVGSGDAFLAGFVAARYGGSPVDECLRFGVACGAESTQRLGAGLVDPREVERLVDEVDVAQVTEGAAA